MRHRQGQAFVLFCVVIVMGMLLIPIQAGAATDVGTASNPVRLSAAADEIDPELTEFGEALADLTGLEFVVEFVDREEPAVEWMCSTHRSSSMRIAMPEEYVYASGCGVEARLMLIRFGSSSHSTEFLVPDGSSLDSLDDLAGLDWYYSDEGSISGYRVPLGMLTMAGVTDQNPIMAGSHTGAVEAVYDNSVASSPTPVFASVFTDARNGLASKYPDVFDEVRVLVESPAIPHPPIAFGPTFPQGVRAQIEAAIVEMADEESPDYSSWESTLGALFSATGVDPVGPADFAFLKSALDASGVFPWADDYAWGTFLDDNTSIFEADIEWLAGEGITRGCNPPTNDRFCPHSNVTRGQMAAFLVRALDLPPAPSAGFTDTVGTTFEKDIDRLAAVGITKGCNPPANDRFCPDDNVRREVMAAFLVRAMGYTDDGGGDLFVDDDSSIFEADIDKLATAGVTRGCSAPGNDRFCPTENVTRGQMAAFLRRALG